jgi:outer membrane protein
MKKIFLPFFFFALSLPSARAEDLLQIYRQAKENDAQFAMARARLEAGREQGQQGLSGLLPSLSLSGNTTWNDNENRVSGAPSSASRYNSNGYTLTLSQPIFRWQNKIAYDQGKLAVAMAEVEFLQARQDLILRVAQVYFEVLNAQVTLDAARAQKLAIAQQLEQATQNFEVGASTIVDTYEAQSRYDLALAQEIASENELEIRREALRVLIGEVPESLAMLDAKKTILPPQPAQMAPWVEAAQKDNLVVSIEEKNAEIAAREVEKNKAGHYPTLDVVANHNLSNSGSGRTEAEANSIGLQLNLPLFQGGYVSSKTREAAANYTAALSNLESARRNAALNARQSYLNVVNGLAQIKALEAALASSLASLESNKLGYEVGVRINIDVLNAEQQVFSTRRDLARAYHDTLIARLRLKNAIGTLDEADVAEINALLK